MTTATVELDRAYLLDWYRRNRERSANLFALIDEPAMHDRPIPLRHPFVFYEGHLPVFSYLTLNERALGEAPIDPALEKLFERGIDPSSLDAARALGRSDWPSRERVEELGRLIDDRVERALGHAKLIDNTVPRLVRAQSAYTILDH
jgi:hypothetical protein